MRPRLIDLIEGCGFDFIDPLQSAAMKSIENSVTKMTAGIVDMFFFTRKGLLSIPCCSCFVTQ
jgi:hypothetical protein